MNNKNTQTRLSVQNNDAQNNDTQSDDNLLDKKLFSSLQLSKEVQENLENLGYIYMSPIQEVSIPAILSGSDFVGWAKTGSGKTLAFSLPIAIKIDPTLRSPQALIVCPTRELGEQIATSFRKIAKFKQNIKTLTLYGGTPMRKQIESLKKGAHVLIGTPGRICDHLGKNTLELEKIAFFVLDEADKMLDMGFAQDIEKIASNLPFNRQNALFSATFPQKIEKLAKDILQNPIIAKGDIIHKEGKFSHYFYESSQDKIDSINKIISIFNPSSLIIFCTTKEQTREIEDCLWRDGHDSVCLNGDMEQINRNEAITKFANKSAKILVATDVASRGLDIEGVDLVINIGFAKDYEAYIHRSGRGARGEGDIGICATLMDKNKGQKAQNTIDFLDLKEAQIIDLDKIEQKNTTILASQFFTIIISGGKKDKWRAGDVLGALSKELQIEATLIGKIDVLETRTYVGIDKSQRDIFKGVQIKIKGKKARIFV